MRRNLTLLMVTLSLALGVGLAGLRAESVNDEAEAPSVTSLAGYRVAVLVGEGFHDAEAMMPIAMLANRGAEVVVLAPELEPVKAYNSELRLHVHEAVGDARPESFDALVLPGGTAPRTLCENAEAVAFVKAFAGLDRPVAAICHGPLLLAAADVLDGRNITGVGGIADELRQAGATYHDREMVRDEQLITSRLPRDIPAWLIALEEAIEEALEEVALAVPCCGG